MAKTILIAWLALWSFPVAAQTAQIDSLVKSLQMHLQPDTIRLAMLNDLAFYYKESDPAKGVVTADSAIVLALALEDNRRLASAYNYKGLNYASMGEDSTALYWLGKCLSIHRKSHNAKGEAAALHNMGISYANLSRYQKALECQQQAYQLCQAVNNQYAMAVITNSIGVVYLFLSDYPRALSHYFQALHLHEQMKDTLNIGIAYTNIGLVYYHAADLKKSLSYQEAAVKIFEQRGADYNLQNALANVGNVYVDSGEVKKALGFYVRALEVNKRLDNRSGMASDFMNMGTAYYRANDLAGAWRYLQRALALYRQTGNDYGAGQALNYLVDIYLSADDALLGKMGIAANTRLAEAMRLQEEGIKMGLVSGNLEIQRDGWQNTSTLFTRKREFARALDAYKKYIVLRDSIFNDDKRAEITRLTMQYGFDKKEAAAKARQEQEKTLALEVIDRQKRIKNSIMGGASVLLFAGLISFAFYKRKRDAQVRQREAELKAEVTDTEMKALRAQMNPHFIFNSLNSISEFIHQHETETADYYLARFAALMRMILEHSQQKEIPLADDLRALEIYMQLEALRLNQKFTYEIDVAKNIDGENTLVPPLLLQPFVENSIWHGMADKPGKGKIRIEIRKEKDMINCVVEDNGTGMKTKHRHGKEQKSLGMKITVSRIALLNKVRKTNGSVNLLNQAEGMRVEIRLPLMLTF